MYLLLTNSKRMKGYIYQFDMLFLDKNYEVIKKITFIKNLKTIIKETKLDLKEIEFNNETALKLIDIKEIEKIDFSEISHIFTSDKEILQEALKLNDKNKGCNMQIMCLNTIRELMFMNNYLDKTKKIDELELLKDFKYRF